MKVIQISDCHLFADSSKVGYQNINPLHSLKHILAAVKQHQPDVLLVTGDISGDGSTQSYQHFSALFAQADLDCKIGVIPGNHDNQQHLKAHVSAQYLWLNTPQLVLPNQWHIHLLDSQFQQTIGRISDSSLSNLTDYVSLHTQDFHLLAVHHHPIPCGGWMDNHEWTNRQQFNGIVAENKAIKGVIYGHIHMAIEQQKEQCLYLACPSTCWQYANNESFATTDLMPGFRVLNLLDSGQLTTSIHRLTE